LLLLQLIPGALVSAGLGFNHQWRALVFELIKLTLAVTGAFQYRGMKTPDKASAPDRGTAAANVSGLVLSVSMLADVVLVMLH
jgi:hypothetical protein